MKKKEIFVGLGILLTIYVFLSWIIPVGYYNSGVFTNGTITPVGFADIIKYPLFTFTNELFILTAITIVVIGGLYGVMKKTGLYSKLIDNVCKKFKGDEELFLIISTFVLALFSSLTALTIPLFVLVPFVAGVLLVMGYNKLTALLSSVGAILVGNMSTTYGFNIAGYIKYFYGTDINANMLFKIILFVLLTGGLIIFLLLINKNTKLKQLTKDELKEVPFYEEIKNNKNKSLISSIILILAFILILVGMYNWSYSLGITIFDKFDEAISNVKYNNLSILNSIMGEINPLGYWTNYEFCLVLIIVSYIIGKIGKLKFSEIASSFIDGCKVMFKPAIMTIFASVIFLFVNMFLFQNGNSATIYATMCNYLFTLFDKVKLLSVGVTSFIGGILYNDFPYMLNSISTPITSMFTNLNAPIFLQYSIYGLVQFVAPTSIILVAGLTYLDVSYKEYLKSIWKPLLVALGIIILLTVIMSLI